MGESVPSEEPDLVLCPISQEVMEDPVCTADGHTYERREIFRWLCKHDTSPLTGAPVASVDEAPLVPGVQVAMLPGAGRLFTIG